MEKLSLVNESFHKFSVKVSKTVGSPRMFIGALLLIIVWLITGPVFHFSDTWQLVINTGTTIITFLMVFVIQNSQNREAAALQLKLDELIRAVTSARNNLVNLEEFSDEELERLREEFRHLPEGESLKRPERLKKSESLKKGNKHG
jgi:low affinity Fe/Cu permease